MLKIRVTAARGLELPQGGMCYPMGLRIHLFHLSKTWLYPAAVWGTREAGRTRLYPVNDRSRLTAEHERKEVGRSACSATWMLPRGSIPYHLGSAGGAVP